MFVIGTGKICCYLLVAVVLLAAFAQLMNPDWGQGGQEGTDPTDYDWDWGQPPPWNGSTNATSIPRVATNNLTFDHYLDQVINTQSPAGTLMTLAPPTLRGTFLATQALQQLGFGADVDSAAVQGFIESCYNASSHFFIDATTNAVDNGTRVSGYSAIEATYYAVATLNLLGVLEASTWQGTANAIGTLQDETGGFACRPGICTTHDAFFAFKALQLLGVADMADADALASFLDGRQMSDPAQWWEYGAFINIPMTTGLDTDFTEPNLVSAYYAVATLAACGRLGVMNEAGLVQYLGLLKNASSGLFSYAAGNERAEHVGTAHLLAIDHYLASDGTIAYTTAGTALLSRLESGFFNEGRKAPANHTLSAACEMVWGLTEGGRLAELSLATKEKLRNFISLHLVSAGSMKGYALTRLASFHELANLLPAITGAGKMDNMSINTLYAYIKGAYSPIVAYFTADGAALLQRDLPDWYNPTSPDGSYANGIAVTLPALQVLKTVGRLNDFLGETHALAYILGNITASQFLNLSALTVHGAFCPWPSLAEECQAKEFKRGWIGPQWTLQSLEAIAILDPVTPQSHYDAGAVWQYLSQRYVEYASNAYFSRPTWIDASDVEWTCRVSTALIKAGMGDFFNSNATNRWVLAHLNSSSLSEVAAHLKLVTAAGIQRGEYDAGTLCTLQEDLLDANAAWYHSQLGSWPAIETVGALATLRADRGLVLTHSIPVNATTGNTIRIATRVGSVFLAEILDAGGKNWVEIC